MKHSTTQSEPQQKLASEMKQFEAMGAWCTPEFLMQSSQSQQSTLRVGEHHAHVATSVGGRYLASRSLLAGVGQMDSAISELQRLLERKYDKKDGSHRDELLQRWMSVERGLSADERGELQTAVLERLFPDSKRPSMQRNDGAAHVGGH